MAPVVVAFNTSFALNERRDAVEVAEARLERNNWSCATPDDVFTISNLVCGEVVPMPTLPLVAKKSEEVAVRVLVPLKYGNCPVVPENVVVVAMKASFVPSHESVEP